ncbi:MAG: right-handed parallel beta-helix repeat-containing protein [Acidobacteriota bacterium]|nr:right-handed parallel beta-helix repeat-containing protein [Acidobacteriota bacterium]
MHFRWAVVLCAAFAAAGVRAESALVVAGGVFQDRAALAVRANFVPAPNVRVKLYRDNGDRVPNATDVPLASARTDASGVYVFRSIAPGDYWVAVDSHSFAANAWPEQTFGPAGSLCAQPDGSSRTTWFEGACFGGRTAASDDANALATSEHVAFVSLRESATAVDFAFSYDAVTSTADGANVQGTLRQFIANANAVSGANSMRFVPIERATERTAADLGVPPRWWTITLASPLTELTDPDTTIDGTAYNFLSPASKSDVNPGRYGESATIKSDVPIVPRLEKPELDIALAGTDGLVCATRCGIRAVALHGATNAVVARNGVRFEHVLVGATPDVLPSAPFGTTGVQIEKGLAIARQLLVTAQTRAGIIIGREAQLDAENLDVTRCGDPARGAGVLLLSDGSTIRSSTIASNPGVGILIGSPDGSAPANGNTIDGCTIAGNQAGVIFGPGSSRNVVTRNDIMWNRLGGVTSAPFENASLAPRENRLSANRFNENGLRPIVLNLAAENPNELARGAESCERIATAANGGIPVPVITAVNVMAEGNAARVTIRGRACPGEVVELYQSFVTSGVREKRPELPRIRDEKKEGRETIGNQQRAFALPSIGEFNYLGVANTAADGTFEATFPLPLLTQNKVIQGEMEETNIWASQVLPGAQPSERAFSAIAIDPAGNTSEMSVRRLVE